MCRVGRQPRVLFVTVRWPEVNIESLAEAPAACRFDPADALSWEAAGWVVIIDTTRVLAAHTPRSDRLDHRTLFSSRTTYNLEPLSGLPRCRETDGGSTTRSSGGVRAGNPN
ncbi:hypothetical protein DPEC_G00103380 [Dallia pectoralis]|uniref:Uncharacterized protein n=1 Tax=Dallia pectoralis TaxID=75939 RepID=A0ACC2GXA9_DALPE|nr:hypothetical protein DPEC_G00103380 [Dallia pectoralis]